MISPDMEVIKEVPGYRVILKAVLKSQIQQLIEQLALATNEESIILTASVADGTLSHLGSDSAKGFLQDHEDVKSQFLGYCLKTHHRKKQEEERRIAEEAQVRLQQQQQQVTPSKFSPGDPRGSFRARSPRFMAPRQQGALHPVTLTRAGPGVRHEPYSIQSPRRQMASSNSGPGASQAKKVKTEPEDTESAGEDSFHNVANEDENSKSSVGQNDGNQEGLGLGAEFSNFMSGDNTEHGNNSQGDFGAVDPNVKVKLEQTTDADMDELEITGVEPGHVMAPPPDSWDPNVSMTADPTGASGSQEDMASQQGYTRTFSCEECGRTFVTKFSLLRHLRLHSAEPTPYMCSTCGKKFQRTDHMRRHELYVHTEARPKIREEKTEECLCAQCGKSCRSKQALRDHQKCTHQKNHVCELCGHRFGKRTDLARHTKSHLGEKEQCPQCGEQFRSLQNHLKNCNPNNVNIIKEFSCDLCGKLFSCKRYLSQHKISSHMHRKYRCQFCPEEFKHRSSRLKHIVKLHPKPS